MIRVWVNWYIDNNRTDLLNKIASLEQQVEKLEAR